MKIGLIKKEINNKKVIIRYFINKDKELEIGIKFIKNDFFYKYSERAYCFYENLLFLEVKIDEEELSFFNNKNSFKKQLSFLHDSEIVYEVPTRPYCHNALKEYFLKIKKHEINID